jgi:hypothetical protein
MLLYPLPFVGERKGFGRFFSGSVSLVADGFPNVGGIIRGNVTVDKERGGPGTVRILFSATIPFLLGLFSSLSGLGSVFSP